MGEESSKGRICVTGGTGFLGSWTIKKLLEDGYSVNATVRLGPERKRDISYLTNLSGASERLTIFYADLDDPESFATAIKDCVGVFHMAHPLDFEEKEAEEVKIKRVNEGLKGILQACADAKTIRRVIFTSSISTAAFGNKAESGLADETCWTDVELIRSAKVLGGAYIVTKVLVEKAALDLAEKLGIDLVSVLPTWVHGPFISPRCPDTVYIFNSLLFGDDKCYSQLKDTSLVHVDDVARAHIHLFEYPEAKGRYICSAVEVTIEDLCDFLSVRYPEYKMPTPDSWKDVVPFKISGLSTDKLGKTGFEYKYGLEEIYDGAVKSCKERGLL